MYSAQSKPGFIRKDIPEYVQNTQLNSIFEKIISFGSKASEKPTKKKSTTKMDINEALKTTLKDDKTSKNTLTDSSLVGRGIEEQLNGSIAATASISSLLLPDPILGELVADLGYKRVYLTSISALFRTSVWNRQRTLRRERLSFIAERIKQQSQGDQPGLPGVITLFEDIDTKEVGIIDGQHRTGALDYLSKQGTVCRCLHDS